MKKLNILAVGVVTVLAFVAMGCGGDEGQAVSTPEDGPPAASSGGGMVAPNTFLVFQGQRYELVHLLQADLVKEAEFKAIGEASDADIDFSGKLTVYERQNDGEAVYTLSPETVDDVAFWLRWRKV